MASPDARLRPARVLCAGMAVLDEIYQVDVFPTPLVKTRARGFVATSGGGAANAAIAIARLGGHARLAAPLGATADAVGERILDALEGEGIDCSGVVRVPGAASSISAIVIDATGERIITNYRDPRLDAARIADAAALLGDVDAVLIDNRFPEFVLPVCAAARQRGIPVILDGDKPTRHTDEMLGSASHVVFSAEGLSGTAGGEGSAEGLRRLRARVPGFLAATDGANDMLWLEGETLRRLPVFPVDVVDTLGCGDVFHGAFALAIAEGRDAVSAMRFAAAAAALKCTRFGGGAGAPTRTEVEALLATT
jgi:sulfofructose kinase